MVYYLSVQLKSLRLFGLPIIVNELNPNTIIVFCVQDSGNRIKTLNENIDYKVNLERLETLKFEYEYQVNLERLETLKFEYEYQDVETGNDK